MTKMFLHEFSISVIGPKGHHHVNNHKFSNTDHDTARDEALARARAIISQDEFSSIKHFNSFDVVIDYVKTEITGARYSFKRGDIIT